MKIIIEHPMPTSAQMRERALKRIRDGLLLGAFHNTTIPPSHYVMATGTIKADNEYAQPKGRKPVRKSHNRNGSACHGKDVPCLAGLNGKCVACYEDD